VTCTDAVNLVEAIAAGDFEVDASLRSHFETCPRCAAALASARRVEEGLRTRPAVQPPARFTDTVVGRIRKERWQSEQRVDRLFNVAIVVAVLLVAGSIFAMTNVGAVLGAAGSVWGLLASASGRTVDLAAPTLLTYIAAACLLMSALGMWWWADRRVSL
jgi:anti-sigma factor RsiW